MISSNQPPGVTGFEVGPASSPTITVPHGVQRTGSHDVIPVRIVSTTPSERRTRCSVDDDRAHPFRPAARSRRDATGQ
jgi:hypothetical protein